MDDRRVETEIQADFAAGQLRASGKIRNLGENGLYVGTDTIPEQGEPVRLRFTAPGGDYVRVSGLVWWTSRDPDARDGLTPGFGMRLLAVSPTYRMLISELLR